MRPGARRRNSDGQVSGWSTSRQFNPAVSHRISGSISWVDFVSLIVAVASLGVTLAIFQIGRRLSFRERRQRDAELTEQAWKVLGPIRKEGLNSKVIVMNAARYARGYDGSNVLTWRGYPYAGPEITEIDHSDIEFILGGQKSYWSSGELTGALGKLCQATSEGFRRGS